MGLLKTCWCGCCLRTGTLIIGIIEMMLLLLLFGCAIGDVTLLKSHAFMRPPELRACFYCIILASIIFLLAGCILDNMWLMMPWLGTHMIGVISLPIYLVCGTIEYINIFYAYGCDHPKQWVGCNCSEKWTILLIEKLSTASFFIYCVLIVLSQYDELRKRKTRTKLEEQILAPITDKNP